MPLTSERFKKAALGGGKPVTRFTCTPPGGQPIGLTWTSASVSCDMSSASRYSASTAFVPEAGRDIFRIITTPGAKFSLDQGFDFGGGAIEVVPMGRYELARDSADIYGGEIRAELIDQWARLERARFTSPYTAPAGTRAGAIATVVSAAIPGVVVKTLATGGSTSGTLTWDRSRTQMISDLATDGGLDCYFDAEGAFVIRPEPLLTPSTLGWTFKSGPESNILSADRERPFDRLYNRVVVVPQDETQAWAAQSVDLTDTAHPLHKSKYGDSPFFWSSPSIGSAAAALTAAKTILQRFQGMTETISVSSFGYCALEAGQTVSVVNERTETDPGFAAIHYLDSFNFDCESLDLQANTRSSSLADIEEAA